MTVSALRYSTRYNIASAATCRAGTIGLYFSTAGAATFTTRAPDGTALDTVTCTVAVGTEIETGPLLSVGTVPANTVALVGR
jgi:hypothetical protein